jgi:hypothetical protein
MTLPDSVVEAACRAHFGLLKSLDRTVDWDHYVAESALPDRAFTEKIIAEHRRRMRAALEAVAPMLLVSAVQPHACKHMPVCPFFANALPQPPKDDA